LWTPFPELLTVVVLVPRLTLIAEALPLARSEAAAKAAAASAMVVDLPLMVMVVPAFIVVPGLPVDAAIG
jgi:hypothetical protein